jgi:hypothetical protein
MDEIGQAGRFGHFLTSSTFVHRTGFASSRFLYQVIADLILWLKKGFFGI